MCWRQACDTQKPEPLRRHHSLTAHSLLPLAEKQRRVLRNLRRLQGLGLVRASDCYQGLVDELAKVTDNPDQDYMWLMQSHCAGIPEAGFSLVGAIPNCHQLEEGPGFFLKGRS